MPEHRGPLMRRNAASFLPPITRRLGAVAALSCLLACSRRAEEERPPKAAASEARSSTRSACATAPLAVQVLGSGGPIPDDARASAGYLLWIEGHSRALVDAGGGVFQRFGASGASLDELRAIFVTHLHADHSADLVALFKGGYFSSRDAPLPILGPTGSARFPPIDEYLRLLLSPEHGAYRYLSGYLTRARGWFQLVPKVLDAESRQPVQALTTDTFRVAAVGVEHGSVPALGYLFTVGDRRIAFAGDQSGNNPAFVEMARGADLLVMHHAVPEGSGPSLQKLHATPSQIGRVAGQIGAGRLVLSHNMQRALDRLDEGLSAIRQGYRGPVVLAGDLDCYVL